MWGVLLVVTGVPDKAIAVVVTAEEAARGRAFAMCASAQHRIPAPAKHDMCRSGAAP